MVFQQLAKAAQSQRAVPNVICLKLETQQELIALHVAEGGMRLADTAPDPSCAHGSGEVISYTSVKFRIRFICNILKIAASLHQDSFNN